MSVLIKPGPPIGARAPGVTGSPRTGRDADARYFADCLAMGSGERDARDDARRRAPPVASATTAGVAPFDGRHSVANEELTWRLTTGRFAGLVVQARIRQQVLCITLIPAHAGQRALAMRHRARIEAACAARFAGFTVVTWRDATDRA